MSAATGNIFGLYRLSRILGFRKPDNKKVEL